MVRCENCHKSYDEKIAAGICPYCGCASFGQDDQFHRETEELFLRRERTEQSVPVDIDPTSGTGLLNHSEREYVDPRWLQAGEVLHSRYEICEVIGSGGFGITYKVWDNKNQVYKAVKEYFQQGVVNRIPGTKEVLISAPKRREEFEYGKERLLTEAQIVAKFQSSSIVRVDDYFEENNTAYMVMEYLESQTLEDYILAQKQVLEPNQVIDIGVHICEALEEIHKAGVVHRDIAPDNIFIDADGGVKIIDFGSARLSKEDMDDRLIVLKPGFAPPEQYEKIDPNNDRQQAWTDVYALGATLYLCLTGTVPAESSDRKADYDRDTDRVPYPKDLNPHIPDFLNNTIMTAMAINIHERFQNASELKAALQQERKVLPVEVVRKKKKLRRTAGISGAFVIALLLILIGIQRYQSKKEVSVLDAANISIWYSVSGDANLERQKNEVMEKIKEEIAYSDKFSQIVIDMAAIPESEYAEKLEIAYTQGEMPTLFESCDTNADYMVSVEKIEGVLGDIAPNSCYFIDDYFSQSTNINRVPTGFHIPVIYINTSLVTDEVGELEITSMADFMELCDGEMAYKPVSVNQSLITSYEKMFSDFLNYEEAMSEYTLQDFLDGKTAAYFADTSDYYTVRDSLPGYFTMIPVSAPSVVCRYTGYWSISDCDDARKLAAEGVLAYLLSNFAQDQFYLQTSIPGLPLEQTALNDYTDVRPPFADLLTEQKLGTYVFE